MNYTQRYALYGALFGLSFPVVATLIAAMTSDISVVAAQSTQPLLWIIDTAPIFLGVFASMAGRRQDVVVETLVGLAEANDRLTASNEELIEARNLKSQFLANVSHELRTPLNAIIGFSRIMLRKTKDQIDEKQQKNLQRIYDSGVQLLGLVNDLLDIERIEAGMLKCDPAEFDIVTLTEELIATTKPMALEKGLQVEFDVEDEIRLVYTDPGRMRQLLTNLIVNAIKYSDEGTIRVRFYRRDDKAVFEVADEGLGIAEDALPYIFDAFRQVDGSSTRSVGGVGLGLNLVNQLSKLLGGDVTVESEVGKGSTFALVFSDEIIVQSESLPQAVNLGTLAHEAGDARGSVVLVIDDDSRALDIARYELIEAGFRPHVAASGAAGLKLAHTLKPDVIVLDIVMPDMDGWAVLQKLKADPALADIPVVVASFIDKTTRVAGMRGWISKPFNAQSFRQYVADVQPRKYEEILVVEDDRATRELILQSLEPLGARLRTAESGPAALDALQTRLPSAVVLDLMLPGLDGFGVLAELRERLHGEGVPVVVYTAKELTDAERLQLKGGLVTIVGKATEDSVDAVTHLIEQAIEHSEGS